MRFVIHRFTQHVQITKEENGILRMILLQNIRGTERKAFVRVLRDVHDIERLERERLEAARSLVRLGVKTRAPR